jgi:transposase
VDHFSGGIPRGHHQLLAISPVAAIDLEAGPLSQWLHRGLANAGLDVVLMETRQVKGALKAMPIKTDCRDAVGIARLLHLGLFRPVLRKSVSAQEVRAARGPKGHPAGHEVPQGRGSDDAVVWTVAHSHRARQ